MSGYFVTIGKNNKNNRKLNQERGNSWDLIGIWVKIKSWVHVFDRRFIE